MTRSIALVAALMMGSMSVGCVTDVDEDVAELDSNLSGTPDVDGDNMIEGGTIDLLDFDSALFRRHCPPPYISAFCSEKTLAYDVEVTNEDLKQGGSFEISVTANDGISYRVDVHRTYFDKDGEKSHGPHYYQQLVKSYESRDFGGFAHAGSVLNLTPGEYRIFVTPQGPYKDIKKYVRFRTFFLPAGS